MSSPESAAMEAGMSLLDVQPYESTGDVADDAWNRCGYYQHLRPCADRPRWRFDRHGTYLACDVHVQVLVDYLLREGLL